MQQDNKKNQSEINKLSWLFIITLASYLLLTVGVSVVQQLGVNLSGATILLLILSEVVIIVPAIIFIFVKKLKWREDLGFNRIRIGTVFLSVLLGFLIMPVASFVNILSQFFVSNTMLQATDQLFGGSGAGITTSSMLTIFITGVLAPFCEEFLFRGFFGNGYSKYGTPLKAMFLSAILFGLMHMNVNQLCYALLMGIVFFIANRASGSTYTSFIAHAVINTVNMFMLLASTMAMEMAGDESLAEAAEAVRNSDIMVMMAVIYGVLAVIFGGLTTGCIILIALVQKRTAVLKATFSGRKEMAVVEIDNSEEMDAPAVESGKRTKVFLNVPTVISIVVCVFIIFFLDMVIAMIAG